MMIQAVLGNPHHPEYGVATIPFPIPRDQYAHCMRQLVQALETTTGKKQYGYLKKPLKQLVDTVVDALTELPEVSECYEVWNQIHEELNECYGHSTPWERLPLKV